MAETPSPLEIRIHLTNGKIETFVQDDPQQIEIILTNLQPQKLFAQEQLVIAGRYSMTAYLCSSICLLELVMDRYPGWPFPAGIEEIVQISEQEFWERFRPGEDEQFVREQPRAVGQEAVGYSEIELVSGQTVYAEFHTKIVAHLDRLHLFRQLLSTPTLYARRRDGGVVFVNSDNIARFGMHPGPPEAPKTAWPAHHKTDKKE